MPVYEFECRAGHKCADIFPAGSCPKSVKCACGLRAKKVVSRARYKLGRTMNHVSDDDDEMEARIEQRNLCECRIAMGVASGATGRGSMGPTAAGVQSWKERIARGEKIPEEYTYGVDLEALNAQSSNC